MVQINTITATGQTNSVSSNYVTLTARVDCSFLNASVGDTIVLNCYGYILGSGKLTTPDGSPLGTYSTVESQEFPNQGQEDLQSTPITFKAVTTITFTHPFDTGNFSIFNGTPAIRYVSPTNKEWSLTCFIKHESNTLLETPLKIPKHTPSPFEEEPVVLTSFYTFKDGALSGKNLVFYFNSTLAGLAQGTKIKIPKGTRDNFKFVPLQKGTELSIFIKDIIKEEGPFSVGGVYQVKPVVNDRVRVVSSTEDLIEIEILSDIPPKRIMETYLGGDAFTENDLKAIWDNGGNAEDNVASVTVTPPQGEPRQLRENAQRYVSKQGASGDGAYKPPKGKLTVHHYVTGTATSLFPDEVTERLVGEVYQTSPKTKEGYTLGNVVGVTQGTHTREPIVVTYYYDKIITPPPADPTPADPDVTTKVNVVQSANNGTDIWGNGDCVMCNCEDAIHTKTTITTTTTLSELVQKQSINFDPVVKEAITAKGKFNLIYIMDGTASRQAMVNASIPSLEAWARSVKGTGINFYFESYGHDFTLGPIFAKVNQFKIPGTPTPIYAYTKGDRFSRNYRFRYIIDYMRHHYPGLPTLFVYEGDFQDYDKPRGKTTSFVNAETKATMDSLDIQVLGINDHAKNRTMQQVAPRVYEISTGTVRDILSRDFILNEFAKTVVVQQPSTGKTSIQVSDPNQGVDIVNAYVTEPDGNNRVLQLTSGKLVAEFNPTQSGTHTLHFTYKGKPRFDGRVIATLNGKSTEYPYKPNMTVKTDTVTERSDCLALRQMNLVKLRDFAVMYRDLQTCDLAEEGAKGFYNVWCMFNNVIDQLCYLTELAEKQGFKREVAPAPAPATEPSGRFIPPTDIKHETKVIAEDDR